MSSLHDVDILAWSYQQADGLRRIAAGERVNDVDWPNVIEEIESVGSAQLCAVESLLIQALLHDLKAEAWRLSEDVPHWLAEARRLRDDAVSRYAPSMHDKIDLPILYRRALRRMPETLDGQPPLPVPRTCPVSLDELLGGK